MAGPWCAGALAGLLLAGLVACGGASAEPNSPEDTPEAGDVRVEHEYGTTKVTGVPERIVSLDLQWTDSLLALGVHPVGYAKDSLMPGGTPPWWDRGALSGEALALDDGLPLEKIAALEPDLIVGSIAIRDKKAYATLSRIAPTIAGVTSGRVADWPKVVSVLGDVLDKTAKAGKVTESVDARVSDVRRELPGLSGQTFVLAQYVVGDGRIGVVADRNDGACALFQELGMKLAPPVAKAGERSGDARVFVSIERVDLLRADFLAMWVNGGRKSDLRGIPGWGELPAVESDAAAVVGYPAIVALNTPTPLSTPHALRVLRPYLQAAA